MQALPRFGEAISRGADGLLSNAAPVWYYGAYAEGPARQMGRVSAVVALASWGSLIMPHVTY